MRNKFLLLFFISILSQFSHKKTFSDIPANPTINMIKGQIVSNQINSLPPFKIYYEGTQTISNEDGFFSIPIDEKEKQEEYSLLICKDFLPTFNSFNTVNNLLFNTKKFYKLFNIKKANIDLVKKEIDNLKKLIKPTNVKLRLINRQIERQQFKSLQAQTNNKNNNLYKKRLNSLRKRKLKINGILERINKKISRLNEKYQEFQEESTQNRIGDYWFISEKKYKQKSKSAKIPDNCLIVCLNPKTVSKVENWNFPLQQNFVAFPKILLKKNLEKRNIKRKKSITRSSIKSELYSWENNPIHKQKKEILKTDNNQKNMKITLIK